MNEIVQTSALLILAISHLILQWRCQHYQANSQSFTEWIHQSKDEINDHLNEFGGILTDIADALENSGSSTNQSMSEFQSNPILGALISGIANRQNHASQENTLRSLQENDSTPKEAENESNTNSD